ncbi:hypothetical protein M011DRAFT_526404 [Sporormia fimetaria CBS 119925]|uniref:Uncharacterized protein n=1 Tax=Sporormia fimetaria CBS 119925 TaxID=1340428 RepID=A0A6A6VBC8_9PLEO|nr:hypothetical protein M011DRAFT_526404 [Sporormia fimetaria CBS 119925]
MPKAKPADEKQTTEQAPLRALATPNTGGREPWFRVRPQSVRPRRPSTCNIGPVLRTLPAFPRASISHGRRSAPRMLNSAALRHHQRRMSPRLRGKEPLTLLPNDARRQSVPEYQARLGPLCPAHCVHHSMQMRTSASAVVVVAASAVARPRAARFPNAPLTAQPDRTRCLFRQPSRAHIVGHVPDMCRKAA